MGLLRDGIKGIAQQMGAGAANSGLGGHHIPGFKNSGGPPDQSKNPYMAFASPSPNPYAVSPIQYGSPQTGYATPPLSGYATPPQDEYRRSYDGSYERKGDSGDRYGSEPPRPSSNQGYSEESRGSPGKQGYQSKGSSPIRNYPSLDPPTYESVSTPPVANSSRQGNFRPFALPQVEPGDGSPFMRAYSSEIQAYGISENAFIHFLDDLNVAVTPNPEAHIFNKAASIAGFFVPGAASFGLMGGQILVGIGGAVGKKTATSKCLANANLALFLPVGLEVVTCSVKDVNEAAGFDPSINGAMYGGYQNGFQNGYGGGYPQNGYLNGYQNGYPRGGYQQGGFGQNPMMQGPNPMALLSAYGDALAPVDIQTRIPLTKTGRTDPIAMIGRGLTNRTNQKAAEDKVKKREKEAERAGRHGGRRGPRGYGGYASMQQPQDDGPSGKDVKWLLVRKASPQSTQVWHQTLAAAHQEENSAQQEGRAPV